VRGFARKRGLYVAHLDRTERTILARVVTDVALLLGARLDEERPPADADPLAALAWSTEAVAEPDDPALARLLPSGSEQEDVADEFRRLTQSDLRTAKVERLRMVRGALLAPGEKLEVAPERAMEWAAALTDIRLVLAERLGVVDDEDAERVHREATTRPRPGEERDELRAAMASLYTALTWLQESLLSVMTRSL
jgi:hypothetical protein